MTNASMQFTPARYGRLRQYGRMLLDETRARQAKVVVEGGREYDWLKLARPNQLPPATDWSVWLLMAGRGFGKSRSGAEWVRAQKERVERIALVAPTAADARDVMVEGESGLLAISPPWDRPLYEPSKRRISWRNGAMATLYSADEPERLRGPQHAAAWCFIAGTQISTPYGERSIENLVVGDLVTTRNGPRQVLAVGSHIATVGTVKFSHGRNLVGTAEHPVASSHGWMRLSDLRIDETVCATRVLSGVASAGIDMPADTTSMEVRAVLGVEIATDCIGRYGVQSTVKYPMGMMSTMWTKIDRITTHTISNCYRTASTRAFTSRKTQCREWIGRYGRRLPLVVGIAEHRYSVNNVDVIQFVKSASINEQRSGGCRRAHVSNVAKCFYLDWDNFAVSVVSIWAPEREDRVYNITVDDTPEYFANNILVHNCDEVGSWRYPEAYDMLMFGLRLGKRPQVVVTTTPRPTKLIRDLLARVTAAGDDVVVTRGSTYDNRANLPASFFAQIVAKYEGTRIGRQELNAELLEDVPGALWTREMIESARLRSLSRDMERVVVAIDPAVSSEESSDETGIVVVGKGTDGHGYVLADASGRYTPAEWARLAIGLYRTHGADRIVAEVNNGGDMVEATVRMIDPYVPFTAVRATRGKVIRAEPVAALYEQGKMHHLGVYPQLEDQMTAFTSDFDKATAGYSPDRVDALVWGATDLLVEATPFLGLMNWYEQQAAQARQMAAE